MPAIRGDDNTASGVASTSGNSKKKPLARNSACLTCRTRKVRCDAGKPACGPCVKTALLHGEDPRAIQCDYDSALTKGPSGSSYSSSRSRSSVSSSKSKGKVGELEDKVAQLEAMIRNSNVPNTQPSQSHIGSDISPPATFETYSNGLSRASTSTSDNSGPSSFPWEDPLRDNLPSLIAPSTGMSSGIPSTSFDDSYGTSFPSVTSGVGPSPLGLDASSTAFSAGSYSAVAFNSAASCSDNPSSDQFFNELIYPGWPSDLPAPKLTRKLLDAFFTKPHCCSFLLDRATFEADFSLAPNSPRFPSNALLHSLLAMTYTISAPNAYNSDLEMYWQDGKSTSPAVYHGARAKHWINSQIETGYKVFDLAQAMVLLCFFSWTHARFQEVWLFSGMATRICAPLGLNHLEALFMDNASPYQQEAKAGCPAGLSGRPGIKCMSPPPKSEAERYDRASLMWHAFICDRIAQANTGWASSLDEADITTLLPSASKSKGPLNPEPFRYAESLSLESSSFFISHPTGVVGPFQLYIKASVLMSRVMAFIQRAPWPIGSRAQLRINGKRGARSPSEIRDSPEFKDLDSDTVAFRLSFHRDLKSLFSKFQNTAEDHHLLLAQAIAHVATMLLHQPFSTRKPGDQSFARCLTSARAIVTTMHMLMFSRFDIALLHPLMIFTWAAAGRILVRDIAIQMHYNNDEALKRDNAEIALLIMAMDNMKTPLAVHTRDHLRAILEDPMAFLLPEVLDLPPALRKQYPDQASTTSPADGPSLTRIASDSEGASNRPSPAGTYSSGQSPPVSDSRSVTGASMSSTSPFASMGDIEMLNALNSGSSTDSLFTGGSVNDFMSQPTSNMYQNQSPIQMDAGKPPASAGTPYLDFMNLGGQDLTALPLFEDSVIYA